MHRIIQGKNVWVVGGATDNPPPSNVVAVRINNHIMHQGGHMDLLYHVGGCDPRELTNPEWFKETKLIKLYRPGTYCKHVRRLADEHSIPHSTYGKYDKGGIYFHLLNEMQREYGAVPLTGVFAVWDVLQHGPKSVTVKGFDFYIDDPYKVKTDPHNIKGNAEFFNDVVISKYKNILSWED